MNAIEFSANGQTIKGTGAGQTIAIVGTFHNPFVSGELDAFDAAYGLSNPAFGMVQVRTWPEHKQTLAGPRKRRSMSNGAT